MATKTLKIDDKWSVEYDPDNNDRAISVNRYGNPAGDFSYDNFINAMFYTLLEQAPLIERLRGALKHYEDTFCEGDCSVADEMDSPDCSGCLARQTLNKEVKVECST